MGSTLTLDEMREGARRLAPVRKGYIGSAHNFDGMSGDEVENSWLNFASEIAVVQYYMAA